MATRIETPTAKQRLELAIKLNEHLDSMCRNAGFLPDAGILSLALSARLGSADKPRIDGKISVVIED